MRRLFPFCAALIVLSWAAEPGLAQSPTASQSNTLPADQPAEKPADQPADQPAEKPADQPPDQAEPARPAPQNPGVRSGGVKAGDTVTIGGYGSARYEANTLDNPKPGGFDFRRFVLTADATPNDRLQAYIEIEFERFAQIEVERAIERFDGGVKFAEELEGGNGGEISMEQMWGQLKFGDPFSVRFGMILPPVGRFNMNHDDDRWDIPRRTLVDRNVPILPVKAAWSELGIGAVGSVAVGKSGQLTYQGYVVNGAVLDFTVEKVVEAEAGEPAIIKLASEASLSRGPVNGEGGVRAGTWRVGYSPTLTIDFGFSGYVGGYIPEFLEGDDRTSESREVEERLTSLGIDGLWKRGAFAVEGEYIHTDFGDTDRVIDAFIDSVTGSTGIPPLAGAEGTEAEFAIKDLTPSRHGFWLEGRYKFWREKWKDNFLGKGFENPGLTGVVRYERVTLNDAIEEVAIENGEIGRDDAETLRQERTTVGLAYRPMQTVVFSVAVEFNRRLESPVLVFPRGFPEHRYTSVLAGMAFGF